MDQVDPNRAQPGPRRERFEEWLGTEVLKLYVNNQLAGAIKHIARLAYRIGKVDGRDSIIGVLRGAVNQWDADHKAVKDITDANNVHRT